MRILQLSGLAGPRSLAGGVSEVARIQSDSLRARGHEVSTMSCWYGRPPSSDSRTMLSRTFSVSARGDLRFTISPLGLFRLRRLKSSYDVVHIHLCRDLYTTVAAIVARWFRLPIVAQTHGMVCKQNTTVTRCFDKLIFDRVLSSVSRFLILADSEAVEIESMGVESTKLTRIHNAVEQPRYERYATVQPIFVFASRLHARKQPEIFVEAAFRVLEDGYDAKFVLAGPDFGEQSKLESLIGQSSFGSNIDILGPVSSAEIGKLLSTATAMVLPSRREPYPMIALEACAAHCPLIISDDTGVSELLRDCGAAFVVPPDAGSVTAAMIRVLRNPQLATETARLARKVYDSNWSPDGLARVLEFEYGRAMLEDAAT